MKASGYFFLSFISTVGLLIDTFINYDFYNGIIYLNNTNFPKVILMNFFISAGILIYLSLGIIIKFS